MQKHWIKKEGSESLIIFTLGWASDHHAVRHIQPAGYDILCVYDYRTIELVTPSEVSGYKNIYLFAWSFGVWVAEQIVGGIDFIKAVAFCGTPYPVSNRFGIPEKSIAVTLKGIRRNGMQEFNRRTYGDFYQTIGPHLENRSMEVKIDELQILTELSQKEYSPSINWDRAIIGIRDVISPLENVTNFWGAKGVLVDIPHYPFADPSIVTKELSTYGSR